VKAYAEEERTGSGLLNAKSEKEKGEFDSEILYSDVIKDISFMIWPGKNRRSELGGIWESEFGFLRGNFLCGALHGAFPHKLWPHEKPRERN